MILNAFILLTEYLKAYNNAVAEIEAAPANEYTVPNKNRHKNEVKRKNSLSVTLDIPQITLSANKALITKKRKPSLTCDSIESDEPCIGLNKTKNMRIPETVVNKL